MLKQLFFLLFCSCGFYLSAQRDTISTSYGEYLFSRCTENHSSISAIGRLAVGNDILEEAEKKGIHREKVYVAFTFSEAGIPISYIVKKPGELTSFNLLVENFCKALISNCMTENIAIGCPSPRPSIILLPFTLVIQ